MRSSTVVSETAARLRAPAALSRTRSAVLLALAFILLTTEAGQGRAPAAPLNFFKNYFVTGDYRVYGVPIKGSPASGGFTTKDITIPLNSVPAGAEPVAAYLYWSAVVAEQSPDVERITIVSTSADGHRVLARNNRSSRPVTGATWWRDLDHCSPGKVRHRVNLRPMSSA